MDAGNPYITYGISEKVVEDKDSHEIREGRFCKKCGSLLHYNFYHYSQLGDYACTGCDFKRPPLQYDATDVQVGDQLSFVVEGRKITANYKGFYNVYNILAAYTAVRSAGLGAEHFNDMLAKFNPENGRMEEFHMKGTKIILNLAKNPAGFNQNISAVMQDKTQKDIIIVINDNAQDGTDISWLWDVDFDRFKDCLLYTSYGIEAASVRKLYPRNGELPFDSDRKMMSTLHLIDGKNQMIVKGAVDKLLERTEQIWTKEGIRKITEEDKEKIQRQNQEFSMEGLRVLAFTYREIPKNHTLTIQDEDHLVFLGLIAMMDPPREESKAAVAECIKAGIRPVMITGDHKITAAAIAKRVGILHDLSEACEGADIENMSDEELKEFVSNISVYARVSPEHRCV